MTTGGSCSAETPGETGPPVALPRVTRPQCQTVQGDARPFLAESLKSSERFHWWYVSVWAGRVSRVQ